jgi:hypothetical protein
MESIPVILKCLKIQSQHMQKLPVIAFCQIFAELCSILLYQDILIILGIKSSVYIMQIKMHSINAYTSSQELVIS